MRQLSVGVLALLGLQACVYYVERPPRHRRPPPPRSDQGGSPGGWDDPDPGEDTANWNPEVPAIREGRWVFALSAPQVEGGCGLDGLTALTVEGTVTHQGPTSILIQTPLATLEGEVIDDHLMAEGVASDGAVRGEIWVNGVLDGPTRLSGVAEGEGEGCFLQAVLTGYALSE